jgi:hypothetical protein
MLYRGVVLLFPEKEAKSIIALWKIPRYVQFSVMPTQIVRVAYRGPGLL